MMKPQITKKNKEKKSIQALPFSEFLKRTDTRTHVRAKLAKQAFFSHFWYNLTKFCQIFYVLWQFYFITLRKIILGKVLSAQNNSLLKGLGGRWYRHQWVSQTVVVGRLLPSPWASWRCERLGRVQTLPWSIRRWCLASGTSCIRPLSPWRGWWNMRLGGWWRWSSSPS